VLVAVPNSLDLGTELQIVLHRQDLQALLFAVGYFLGYAVVVLDNDTSRDRPHG
jgi:hypothetical protein